jgi:hypothetical protein
MFGMVRELIEQHPRVALALSGNYTLAESDRRWREALKSVRTLPVTFLPPDDARQVFTRPAPDFPPGVYSEAAILRALELTGGQPYLLHLLGETIVNGYNRSRSNGTAHKLIETPLPVEVIDGAIPDILIAGDTCFASIWEWLLRISDTEHAATLLRALARRQPVEDIGDADQRVELLDLFCERDLLAQDPQGGYSFRVPLIGQWIAQQRRLPGL